MIAATTEKRPRFQFSLRKALLWTALVALGLGALTILTSDVATRMVLSAWLATVLILRWAFGRKVAAWVSAVAGALFFGWSCSVAYSAHIRRFDLGEMVWTAVVGGFLGGVIGFLLFVPADAACRIASWFDRIGQRGE